MTHRLTEPELAELERDADIYPYVHVMQHVSLLRWAYAEADRLKEGGATALPDRDEPIAGTA